MKMSESNKLVILKILKILKILIQTNYNFKDEQNTEHFKSVPLYQLTC